MAMKDYRKAFQITLGLSIALAAAVALIAWRYVAQERRASGPKQMGTAAPAAEQSPAAETAPGAAAAALAPVQLSPQRLQSIGVTSGEVVLRELTDEIRAAGNVAVDERRQAYVQTRFSGWITKVYADATYQYVRKGQPLFTIYSPQLVTTEQEYLLARKNSGLLAQSTVPGVASGAESLLTAARARLQQWDIPSREIDHIEKTGEIRHDLEIDSPVSGYITERNALPNLYVEPATRLYTLADLSTVWVNAEVFQSDIGQIRRGQPATVTTDAYPGRTFSGRVDFVYPEVNMDTRTTKVRLVFQNPELKLTPGMFVNVMLKIPIGRRLAIPVPGVFHTGTRNVVFVDHGGGYLEPREVTLGRRAGDYYSVLKGLKPGEKIVTSANFLVDSESQLQAALGSFVPPPPGAGAAASMNMANARQATVDFTTSPSPPTKGQNTVRVKLTGPDGKPITGAEVKVRFFMPAMPAMGMAAMQSIFTLTDRGGGFYQGSGQLQTGGTWQVAITAQKNGQTVAMKQLSVNAQGGM
ncbi:MAG TPA: efflux RND transporter periplasmic adaptor subunit [Terriglobia bacterium]|nr:efflux RND transporter periplasmic adaptor subunit [Terriglobia bacterium]